MKKARLIKVILTSTIIFMIGISYAIWCEYSDIHIPCVFHKITGLLCPGCGTTRMCISLLKFDFVSAFYYNKAIFILLPYLAWLCCKYIYSYIQFGYNKITKKDNMGIIISIIILIVYWIIRNIVPYEYF